MCGVVPGSVHPQYTGIEAGLSATGDIFEAIARRAGTTVAELSQGLESYRAGQTGLLRLSWDNGDRTVLVNPELGGVTLGWNLVHTAQDELFAAIEGTAFHTRIILERMAEHGVRVDRVINAGGIPQNNAVLNQVYANVLNKPVLVPAGMPTSLGSGIFAVLAAGAFKTVEEAQEAMCLGHTTIEPDPEAAAVYEKLYPLYREAVFWAGRAHGCAGGAGRCAAGVEADRGKARTWSLAALAGLAELSDRDEEAAASRLDRVEIEGKIHAVYFCGLFRAGWSSGAFRDWGARTEVRARTTRSDTFIGTAGGGNTFPGRDAAVRHGAVESGHQPRRVVPTTAISRSLDSA